MIQIQHWHQGTFHFDLEFADTDAFAWLTESDAAEQMAMEIQTFGFDSDISYVYPCTCTSPKF